LHILDAVNIEIGQGNVAFERRSPQVRNEGRSVLGAYQHQIELSVVELRIRR
jgi:hypothetical protein